MLLDLFINLGDEDLLGVAVVVALLWVCETGKFELEDFLFLLDDAAAAEAPFKFKICSFCALALAFDLSIAMRALYCNRGASTLLLDFSVNASPLVKPLSFSR